MPASSPLVIATNAVTRLLKEYEYYQKDYAKQQTQIQSAKSQGSAGEDAENAEFLLKQRVRAPELSYIESVSDLLVKKPPSHKCLRLIFQLIPRLASRSQRVC